MRRIGKERGKFLFKIVLSVGLSNKVQNGQTLLTFSQPEAAAKLLQENCQGIGRTQKENCVYFRDVHPFVINVDYENKADLP